LLQMCWINVRIYQKNAVTQKMKRLHFVFCLPNRG
jgi:hypothetical protein